MIIKKCFLQSVDRKSMCIKWHSCSL